MSYHNIKKFADKKQMTNEILLKYYKLFGTGKFIDDITMSIHSNPEKYEYQYVIGHECIDAYSCFIEMKIHNGIESLGMLDNMATIVLRNNHKNMIFKYRTVIPENRLNFSSTPDITGKQFLSTCLLDMKLNTYDNLFPYTNDVDFNLRLLGKNDNYILELIDNSYYVNSDIYQTVINEVLLLESVKMLEELTLKYSK